MAWSPAQHRAAKHLDTKVNVNSDSDTNVNSDSDANANANLDASANVNTNANSDVAMEQVIGALEDNDANEGEADQLLSKKEKAAATRARNKAAIATAIGERILPPRKSKMAALKNAVWLKPTSHKHSPSPLLTTKPLKCHKGAGTTVAAESMADAHTRLRGAPEWADAAHGKDDFWFYFICGGASRGCKVLTQRRREKVEQMGFKGANSKAIIAKCDNKTQANKSNVFEGNLIEGRITIKKTARRGNAPGVRSLSQQSWGAMPNGTSEVRKVHSGHADRTASGW
ncbi:hypothetical protein B0H21DRAFT_712986 [Amylocystis lapponica]|nr:hypothetical protein B0H21DRAFT_712986 [Amylocystis lapponica]